MMIRHYCAGCRGQIISRTIDLGESSITYIGCSSEPVDCDQSIINALPPLDTILREFSARARGLLLPLLVPAETVHEEIVEDI